MNYQRINNSPESPHSSTAFISCLFLLFSRSGTVSANIRDIRSVWDMMASDEGMGSKMASSVASKTTMKTTMKVRSVLAGSG